MSQSPLILPEERIQGTYPEFQKEIKQRSIECQIALDNDAACRRQGLHPYFLNPAKAQFVIQTFCKECLVRQYCLDLALIDQIEPGTWGGFDEFYRKGILTATRREFCAKNPDVSPSILPSHHPDFWNLLQLRFTQAAKSPKRLYTKLGIPLRKSKDKNYLAL